MKNNNQQPTVTETLRDAIRRSGLTQYRICKETGADTTGLGKFLRGEMDLRGDRIDRLCRYLGLKLVPDPDAEPPTPTPENLARPKLVKLKTSKRSGFADKKTRVLPGDAEGH